MSGSGTHPPACRPCGCRRRRCNASAPVSGCSRQPSAGNIAPRAQALRTGLTGRSPAPHRASPNRQSAPASPLHPGSRGSYQAAVILTHEDGFWRFSARRVRSSDVVHRGEGATQSEGRRKPPAGLTVPSAGLRRSVATMNHIAASAPPRQQTGLSILMSQDHRSLVSA